MCAWWFQIIVSVCTLPGTTAANAWYEVKIDCCSRSNNDGSTAALTTAEQVRESTMTLY